MIFGIHPVVIFAIVTLNSIVVFLAVWYFLNAFNKIAPNKWLIFNRVVKKARRQGESPIIKKYGLVGLAVLMAVPVPTIGIYGATTLSWMLGVNWWRALIAVVSGTAVSNGIVLLSVLGVTRVISLFG